MQTTTSNVTPAAGYLLILIGGAISLVAAVISVKGMALVFSGAATTVMILMGSLELGKLAAAACVHLYGNIITPLIRRYLTATAVVLCGITSLGIYSLLANAWALTQSTTNQLDLDRSFIEQRIERVEQRRLSIAESLDRLDASIAVFIDFDRATQAEATREKQSDQRQRLNTELNAVTRDLEDLYEKLAKVGKEQVTLTAKSGVISQIANLTDTAADTSANVFALLIVGAADPLAVLLLITGLDLVRQHRQSPSQRATQFEPPRESMAVGESALESMAPLGSLCQSNEQDERVLETEPTYQSDENDSCTLHARLLEGLENHENTLENEEGERFLRAPTNTIRTLLLKLDPQRVNEASQFVSAIDTDGLPARQIRIDGERVRAIKLPTTNGTLTSTHIKEPRLKEVSGSYG